MINNTLKGKNILFFGPKTFNYETAIKNELEKLGANVTYYNDKPFKSLILIVILRLKPKLVWQLADRVYLSWLKQSTPQKYDIVFVIKGEGLSTKFLDLLHKRYADAAFILYMWDSLKNIKNVEEKFIFFDKIYSFDPKDCKQKPFLNYRPLFFLDKYYNRFSNIGEGVFFIGTLNGDRSKVISKLASFLKNRYKFEYRLFVRSKIELVVRKLFNYDLYELDRSKLIRSAMSVDEINDKINNCCAVLDIEHPLQNGLTMRTFEVLASGKKLITTNKNILGHDFFDHTRISIIDRDSPTITDDFFNTPLQPLPNAYIEKYSLNGWLSEVLQ